nr:uncharacterized protein LOC128669974 [Plodia interpunctella]
MSWLLNSIILVVISKLTLAAVSKEYLDVFLPGASGKPTFGTMRGTCWGRGGICVHIKECPSLKMETSIPGCAWGFMVCCKVIPVARPYGSGRRGRQVLVFSSNMQEFDTNSIKAMAMKNSEVVRYTT